MGLLADPMGYTGKFDGSYIYVIQNFGGLGQYMGPSGT